MSERSVSGDAPVDPAYLVAVHRALRRDAQRVRAAAAQGGVTAPCLRRWDSLVQLARHHAEGVDTVLAPMLVAFGAQPEPFAALAAAWPGQQAALRHAELALRGGRHVGEALDLACHRLDRRVDGERREVAPLVASLPAASWLAFVDGQRTALSPEEEAFALPWLLEGLDGPAAARLVELLPDHVRRTLRAVWIPAYERSSAALPAAGAAEPGVSGRAATPDGALRPA
jgi:hypothetical protein